MAVASATPAGIGPEGDPALRRKIASFPSPLKRNPYQTLLYRELARHGYELEPPARFSLRWLLAARGRVHILHFHWPHSQWRHRRGSVPLRASLSWLKLVRFELRLAAARWLGYRTIWTIHQVYPHETRNRRHDRRGAVALARACDLLITHDAATLELARRELGSAVRRASVVPHGSYLGVYPPGRTRAVVRDELGIAQDAPVFLVFGTLCAYKESGRLLEAFRAAAIPGARLIVAGGGHEASAVAQQIGDDPRIVARLGYVPDERVAELYGASDVVVMARSDGGTSGSLILALSMGVPIVAARTRIHQELVGDESAGWLFDPSDSNGLRDALQRAAAASPEDRRERGRAALHRAGTLAWSESGRQYRGVAAGARGMIGSEADRAFVRPAAASRAATRPSRTQMPRRATPVDRHRRHATKGRADRVY